MSGNSLRPPHPVLLPKGRRTLETPSPFEERAAASSPSPLGERAGVRGDFLAIPIFQGRL